jgi:DNA polymerase-3 subunit delta'
MPSLFADDEEDQLDAVAQEIDDAAPAEPVEVNPRSNPDFIGHEAVEKALLADYLSGRLPHALILAGPPGIGKATLAFRLARFILSQAEQGGGLYGDVAPPTSLYVEHEKPVFRSV